MADIHSVVTFEMVRCNTLYTLLYKLTPPFLSPYFTHPFLILFLLSPFSPFPCHPVTLMFLSPFFFIPVPVTLFNSWTCHPFYFLNLSPSFSPESVTLFNPESVTLIQSWTCHPISALFQSPSFYPLPSFFSLLPFSLVSGVACYIDINVMSR